MPDFTVLLANWRSILAGTVIAILSIMLLIAKGDARHWQKKYDASQAAYALLVSDTKRATAEAEAADRQHAQQVAANYETIRKEQVDALQSRLDAARTLAADYSRRLRAQAAAHSGGGQGTDLPAAADASGFAAGADLLPIMAEDDAAICSANTVKLQGWQDWWKRVSQP